MRSMVPGRWVIPVGALLVVLTACADTELAAPVPGSTTGSVSATPGTPGTPVTGRLTTPPPTGTSPRLPDGVPHPAGPTSRTPPPSDPYLPAGVPDAIFPPGTKAYELLSGGQCGPLLRQIEEGETPTTVAWADGRVPAAVTDLYVAAGNACLARWAPAKAAYSRVSVDKVCELDPDTGQLPSSASSFKSVAACEKTRSDVHAWTGRLLKAHDADPRYVPKFPKPPKP